MNGGIFMEDKQTKRGPGRPRTRTMESFWKQQREWSKSYYDRHRDEICIKQKIRYYSNKLIDALNADKVNEAEIARLALEIAELEAKLEAELNGGDDRDGK